MERRSGYLRKYLVLKDVNFYHFVITKFFCELRFVSLKAKAVFSVKTTSVK